jgi:hypothetical protein
MEVTFETIIVEAMENRPELEFAIKMADYLRQDRPHWLH